MEILAPVFGIFTSFILLYYLSSLNRSNVFLALFFLCCNLVVLVYFGLHYSKVEFWEGVCFVHFLPLSFLLGPLLFFYVKYSVSEHKEFRRVDAVHLLPAAFIVIACWPFTSLPFDVKTKMAHEIVNITEDYRLNFNWITFEEILYGRSIHLIIYACSSMIYFFWNKQILIKNMGSYLPTITSLNAGFYTGNFAGINRQHELRAHDYPIQNHLRFWASHLLNYLVRNISSEFVGEASLCKISFCFYFLKFYMETSRIEKGWGRKQILER